MCRWPFRKWCSATRLTTTAYWCARLPTVRYVWLFKVRAKPVTENYTTKEGTTVTRQTGAIEWTAIKRTHDNRYQAVADEGQNGFTAEKAATFLTEVYEPTFTAPGP